jgi:hypothetical protein
LLPVAPDFQQAPHREPLGAVEPLALGARAAGRDQDEEREQGDSSIHHRIRARAWVLSSAMAVPAMRDTRRDAANDAVDSGRKQDAARSVRFGALSRSVCMRLVLPILLALPLALPARAGPGACSAGSPPGRARLLELYTSEGCNSCPPAERWFTTIPPSETLIPMAFHVDYWDHLGWKDPYSEARNTQRQLRYAEHGGDDRVYTPQVFLDGRELTAWQRGVPESPSPRPATPALELSASRDGSRVEARLEARGQVPDGAIAAFALVEGGLTVEIKAGENKGVTLRQDHVVRAYAEQKAAASNRASLAVPAGLAPSRSAVVAWLQDSRTGAPIQAVRLALDRCGPAERTTCRSGHGPDRLARDAVAALGLGAIERGVGADRSVASRRRVRDRARRCRCSP